MRLLCSVVIGGLIVGGVVVAGEQRGKRGDGPAGSQAPHVQADIRIVFSSGEAQILREHYQSKYRNLPPGLQKKLARTGQLPPGWEKKMEPFPADLERRLSRLPAGHHRGVIDGHAVIYRARGAIVDVAALF